MDFLCDLITCSKCFDKKQNFTIEKVQPCNNCDKTVENFNPCKNFSLFFTVNSSNVILNAGNISITGFNNLSFTSFEENMKCSTIPINPSFTNYIDITDQLICLSEIDENTKIIVSFTHTDNTSITGIFSCNIELSDDWSKLTLSNIYYIMGEPLSNFNSLYLYLLKECDVINKLLLGIVNPIFVNSCEPINITNNVNSNLFLNPIISQDFFSLKDCNLCNLIYKNFPIDNSVYVQSPFIYFLNKYTCDKPLNVFLYFNTPIFTSTNATLAEQFSGLNSQAVKVGLFTEGNQLYLTSDVNISLISGILSTKELSLSLIDCGTIFGGFSAAADLKEKKINKKLGNQNKVKEINNEFFRSKRRININNLKTNINVN